MIWEEGSGYGSHPLQVLPFAIDIATALLLGTVIGVLAIWQRPALNPIMDRFRRESAGSDVRLQFSLRGLLITTVLAALASAAVRAFTPRVEVLAAIYALGPAALIALAYLPRRLSWQQRVCNHYAVRPDSDRCRDRVGRRLGGGVRQSTDGNLHLLDATSSDWRGCADSVSVDQGVPCTKNVVERTSVSSAEHHGVDADQYIGFRAAPAGREMAALLCRRWTGELLSRLSARFALAHPESSSNLVRRAKKRYKESRADRRTVARLEQQFGLKTETKPDPDEVPPRTSPVPTTASNCKASNGGHLCSGSIRS